MTMHDNAIIIIIIIPSVDIKKKKTLNTNISLLELFPELLGIELIIINN